MVAHLRGSAKTRSSEAWAMVAKELLEEEIRQQSIGTTEYFTWYATSIGIAALWTAKKPPKAPPYELALEQALEVGLDLSREEKEFHQTGQGLVLVFHS